MCYSKCGTLTRPWVDGGAGNLWCFRYKMLYFRLCVRNVCKCSSKTPSGCSPRASKPILGKSSECHSGFWYMVQPLSEYYLQSKYCTDSKDCYSEKKTYLSQLFVMQHCLSSKRALERIAVIWPDDECLWDHPFSYHIYWLFIKGATVLAWYCQAF